MSGEWIRSQLVKLINSYKQEPNLYDCRHKLYYHKQARSASLNKIWDAVKADRPETTLNDIQKKIQTLRTQFGQEINKVEKSKSLGDEYLYKPKVWWFKHLEWIGDYMKTRTDNTPLSMKIKGEKNQSITYELEEVDYDEELENTNETYTTEIELAEVDQSDIEPPPAKIQKTFQRPSRKSSEKQDEVQTIEYTLINEMQGGSSKDNLSQQFVEFHEQEVQKLDERHKKRARAFGKYVGALMMGITEDKTFFDLQRNITTLIQNSTIKQQELKKS